MDTNGTLIDHYRHGDLERALLDGLRRAGKDPDRLSAADLMGMDEFHIGGAEATRALVAQLGIGPGMKLLDIGSGLGGPARQLAGYGCDVTGVDLSAEYVSAAQGLSARMGLEGKVAFRQGDAATMYLEADHYDGATLLHVGMNIADKAALAAAVHRALKPGGFFAVYDVMQVGAGTIEFPVPWSTGPETSFVASPAAYRAALEGAGFTVFAERERRQFALDFFAALRARLAQGGGPPPLGLHVLMGASAPQKSANMAAMIERGVIAPVELLARKQGGGGESGSNGSPAAG